RSTYFPNTNFVDPFNSNPLTLSVSSLLDMIFRTSNNVEMPNGALGIYLLLIPIIIIANIIKKDIRFILWSLFPFFGLSQKYW
nr:hypothetical protein [Clostridia bacterium]